MGCRKNLATKRWPLTSWTLWCLMAPLRLVIAPPRLDEPQSSSIGSPCRCTEERTVLLIQLLPWRFLKFTGNVEKQEINYSGYSLYEALTWYFSRIKWEKTQSFSIRIDGFRTETQTTNFQIRSTHWRRPATIFNETYHCHSLFSYDISDLKLKWP